VSAVASPNDNPLEAHCRRVATLAAEAAVRLRLPVADAALLEEAGLQHHYPVESLGIRPLGRLLDDLGIQLAPAWEQSELSADVRAVLRAFHLKRRSQEPERALRLGEILEVANLFDERVEFTPFEFQTADQVLTELDWLAKEGYFDPHIVSALARLRSIRIEDVLDNVRRLPVYPGVALEVLRLAADEDAGPREFEALVSRDQVLAGLVVKAANSSLASPARTISSIRQAIAYIGVEATRRLALASAFQPLFASAALRELWRHSLQVAALAERLAAGASIDRDQVFLAGLVHDVGRLALQRLGRHEAASYTRLVERGCDPVYAELLLAGVDHGTIGGEILRLWAFPEQLVEAVALHHQPEQSGSRLAALLHVAEYLSGSEEDGGSSVRLSHARDRLGVDLAQFEALDARNAALVRVMLGVA
jgi:putative nucleotidyltransferase with HDIG domain